MKTIPPSEKARRALLRDLLQTNAAGLHALAIDTLARRVALRLCHGYKSKERADAALSLVRDLVPNNDDYCVTKNTFPGHPWQVTIRIRRTAR